MKKLIALTGSFNPVTIAHYTILSDAVERFGADEGIFIATDDRYLTRKVTLKSSQKMNFILPETVRGEMLSALAGDIFENTRDLPQRKKWNDNDKGNSRVNTTLAKQLANWVILYSPLQMASDMIEHYEGHPAFQFFRDFNPDCDWSEALQGEPGEYVVIVRRAGEDFFLGATTNGSAREVAVPLDFLANSYQQSAIGGQQSVYEATIYSDGDDAHWETNPTSYKIENKTVSSSDTLYIKMAAGGGCAVRFKVTETPSR